MMKYISIAVFLLLLFIISTSVSITDYILINSKSNVSQDEITHMRNATLFAPIKKSTAH